VEHKGSAEPFSTTRLASATTPLLAISQNMKMTHVPLKFNHFSSYNSSGIKDALLTSKQYKGN